jgi:hypothetical protein
MRLVPALLAASLTATLLPAVASAQEPGSTAFADPPAMNNAALFRGGVFVGGFGVVFAAVGLGLFASGPAHCFEFPCPGTVRREAGTAMMLIAAPLVTFSVPMMIIGRRPPETPVEMAMPAVSIGPRGAGLRWVF